MGHRWVKRLFIDRDFKTYEDEPERDEHPDDYSMIFATVEDNEHMLKNSPTYLKTLANMPEDVRRAYRYGDWNAVGGNYFKEFKEDVHVVPAFQIPPHWTRYRSIDYGLDKLAVLWWAVDEDGRAWCYREYEEKNLVVQEAAAAIKGHTLPNENILATYVPPDLWNRQKDSGKTMADLFGINGVPILRSSNNRVQGHMVMKDMLRPMPVRDGYVKSLFPERENIPSLMFFEGLTGVTEDIRDIQADDKNPNDCAKQPHEVTHSVDSCRYFCVSRVMQAELPEEEVKSDEFLDDSGDDYDTYMCGGEITEAYI